MRLSTAMTGLPAMQPWMLDRVPMPQGWHRLQQRNPEGVPGCMHPLQGLR